MTRLSKHILIGIICLTCGQAWAQSTNDRQTNGETQITDSPQLLFLDMGTSQPGGSWTEVGYAICEELNAFSGGHTWKARAILTNGSHDNIERLISGELTFAISSSSSSYFAARGEGDWPVKQDIRAIVTLAPNVSTFVCRPGANIKSIKDLKGMRVAVGPSGASYELFIEPLINAYDLTYDDFIPVHVSSYEAVDLLSEGKIDAAFLGGLVPSGPVYMARLRASATFIPIERSVIDRLVDKYPFFQRAMIPKETYDGLEEDYHCLNFGSMHLITSATLNDDIAYQITKSIWQRRADINKRTVIGKFINEQNAVINTGTEFHPGAMKFFEEIGIVPTEASDKN